MKKYVNPLNSKCEVFSWDMDEVSIVHLKGFILAIEFGSAEGADVQSAVLHILPTDREVLVHPDVIRRVAVVSLFTR